MIGDKIPVLRKPPTCERFFSKKRRPTNTDCDVLASASVSSLQDSANPKRLIDQISQTIDKQSFNVFNPTIVQSIVQWSKKLIDQSQSIEQHINSIHYTKAAGTINQSINQTVEQSIELLFRRSYIDQTFNQLNEHTQLISRHLFSRLTNWILLNWLTNQSISESINQSLSIWITVTMSSIHLRQSFYHWVRTQLALILSVNSLLVKLGQPTHFCKLN